MNLRKQLSTKDLGAHKELFIGSSSVTSCMTNDATVAKKAAFCAADGWIAYEAK